MRRFFAFLFAALALWGAAPVSAQFLMPGERAEQRAWNSGDCTVVSRAHKVTCLSTNGSPFVPSATTDTTNANNISSGTLGLARGGTGQATAAAARASSGLNVDGFTGHGDSIYTVLATDKVVGTNAAFTASRTWTLPAANAVNGGQLLLVADFAGTVTASNTLVISRAGADTINGGTSVTIVAANGAYLLLSDGSSKWTAQAIGPAAAGGVSSITCNGGLTGGVITTSGTCALSSPVSTANGGTGAANLNGIVQAGTTNTLTVGYTVTANNLGNITSFTVNPALGNYQYGTNHGAATWTAPTSDCAIDILVTNDATAGTITFSGFTVSSSTGDALTTVNTSKFLVSIIRINAVSTYSVKALQ